ncbi:MAG: isoprenylcysteine carboxylmethyltransferase family protein [Desulfobacteraceae bacterium]|nr:isoprenylcysteine carboxylmethyltransferase family protein [Desulfobacteraceae bacterium]
MNDLPDYGLWHLVIFSSLFILVFAFSFFRPRTRRDWRTFGSFSAFVVALFTEMYGFPLTVYLLSGWLGSRYPEVDWFSHDASHLLQTLLGWRGDAHFGPLHLLSYILILGGFILLSASWRVLFRAQQNHEMAVSGPYARVRHPQYAAFIVIMIGFLVQWPTLPTMVMFPVLVWIYVRLARREEKEVLREFGEHYARYAKKTPRFFPQIRGGGGSMGHLDSKGANWK